MERISKSFKLSFQWRRGKGILSKAHHAIQNLGPCILRKRSDVTHRRLGELNHVVAVNVLVDVNVDADGNVDVDGFSDQ